MVAVQKKVIGMTSLERNSDTELLMLPDCAGLLENGKCKWLRVSGCLGIKCSYYQGTNSLEKAKRRLRSLDEDTQEHIAKKYYGGYRPWLETNIKPRG